MLRFRAVIVIAVLAASLSGCSEGQPNPPAKPEEVNADFAAKSAAAMQTANQGMDPKALRKSGGSGPPRAK